MDYDMFFGILIFEPKWGFCMGYSLCIMAHFQNGLILIFDPKWGFCMGYSVCIIADFQNGLIPQIFGVFWSGFLHRTTLKDL